MFRWIDSEQPDASALMELLGTQQQPLPAHKQVVRTLLFMPSLASFGLRRDCAKPDNAFLAATSTPLRCVWEGVIDLRDSIEALVREAYAPAQWREALEQRTAIQLLVDWYGDTLGDLVANLRLDDLDREMRLRSSAAGFVRVTDAPAGVPASHWWWRLP